MSPPAETRSDRGFARTLFSDLFVLLLCIAWFAVMAAWRPELTSPRNLKLLLLSALPLLAVSLGQMCVLITGGIDLSITAVISLASVLGASLLTTQGSPFDGSAAAIASALLAMTAVGVAIGTFHGIAVALLGMPAFLVTLTTLMFASGLAVWYADSKTIPGLPESFVEIWYGDWLRLPYPLLIVAALAIVAHVVLSRTVTGRWLYAVGHSRKTAEISGVPVRHVTLLAYIVSGLCAALAAALFMARLESGSPQLVRQELLLDCIGAVVIGGTSLFGGKGTVLGTLAGVLFITLLGNSLTLLNLSHWHEEMVKGGVILIAAIIDALRQQRAA
jgi:ribose/xylose/arabinose/galactoside ABC-type transport system permease subunit